MAVTDLKLANRLLESERTAGADFERWATAHIASLKAEARDKLSEAEGVQYALACFQQFRKNTTGA